LKTETVLDVVRANFEENLGSSLVRRVEEIGLPQLDEFRVQMNKFVNRARIPGKRRDELRPYVQLYQPGVLVGSG
jgi:hypothetical protein